MPRRKKEIVNALENLNAADVNSIHDMESDEIVLKEFNEEDAAAAMEMLNEMDERKRIDASRSKKRNLYTHESYAGMDDDEEDDLVLDEQVRYENFQKLNMSLISGSILKGEVVKCMTVSYTHLTLPTTERV